MKARKELREKLEKVRTNASEFSNFPMKQNKIIAENGEGMVGCEEKRRGSSHVMQQKKMPNNMKGPP